MTRAKTFALPALALAAVAFLCTAASASATELCKTNTTPCSDADMYKTGTSLKATLRTGTKAVITTNLDTAACTSSETAGIQSATGGSGATAVPGSISTFSFSGCTDSFGNTCTVTTSGLPYALSITGSGAGSSFKLSATSMNIKVACGSILSCTFSATATTLALNGGVSPPLLTVNGSPLAKSGIFCPSTADWSAEYAINTPSPLFVV